MISPQTTEQISILMQGKLLPESNLGVKLVVIDDNLDGREADLITSLGFGKKLAVVSDPETFEALGRRIEAALGKKFDVQHVGLPSHSHPDEETLKSLLSKITPGTNAVIAVGSGTINDLCKMAAHQLKIPQAIFGTAPSMNGYTSGNAAITVGGLKKTLPATAPSGVFLDLAVFAKSPKRLIRSGLGDSLCRASCQADWLLAHLLHDQKYEEVPFAILAEDEKALFSKSSALLNGDLVAMKHLARTLVLSGFGMTICGGSYPASQGEHLISHYVDMMGAPFNIPETFHGEQIGVTTLTMARLQEEILNSKSIPVLRPSTVTKESVLQHFGPELGAACWKEFELKKLDSEKAARLNMLLQKNWNEIRERLKKVIIPSETLKSVLTEAGAQTEACDLGWPEPLYKNAVSHARLIRNRYTFLDFSADLT